MFAKEVQVPGLFSTGEPIAPIAADSPDRSVAKGGLAADSGTTDEQCCYCRASYIFHWL